MLRLFLLSRRRGPSPGRFGIGIGAVIARISSSRRASSLRLFVDGRRVGGPLYVLRFDWMVCGLDGVASVRCRLVCESE